ncbi:SRPBCC family protein [Rapidithrix thailandica]|uniref:SRPBCC family protein n=1 Tax=Rapidithrix thailandica TaxID=413964 RepID=A0AAW9RW26_9BACT
MRTFRFFSLGVLAAVILLALGGYMLPGTYHVKQSILVEAKQASVFNILNSFEYWEDWALDLHDLPNANTSISGTEEGPGAIFTWNYDASNGRMEIVESKPDSLIRLNVQMQDNSLFSEVRFTLLPTESGVLVTWEESGDLGMNPLTRWYAMLAQFDKRLSENYQAALQKLKMLCEK